MESSITNYLISWSLELSAKANQVRNLIGDAHWLTDGQHKEEILKAHLQKYLPTTLRVTRGFIIDTLRDEAKSGEIDILITDASRTAPLLIESDLTICLPASVLGHIEVKTTFNKATCKKAMISNIRNQSIVWLANQNNNAWRALFFYQLDSGVPSSTVITIIKELLKNIFDEDADTPPHYTPHLCLPNVIIILGVCVSFISIKDTTVKIKTFLAADLSAALGILDFYSMISEALQTQGLGDIQQELKHYTYGTPLLESIQLPKE